MKLLTLFLFIVTHQYSIKQYEVQPGKLRDFYIVLHDEFPNMRYSTVCSSDNKKVKVIFSAPVEPGKIVVILQSKSKYREFTAVNCSAVWSEQDVK
jgi:hypothetical protein